MSEGVHEYGCLMIYFDFEGIKTFQKILEPEDIVELEKNPHVTLLYGFHDSVKPKKLINIVKKFDFNHCKVYNVSVFENEEFDVLKFDVEQSNLQLVNQELSSFPHTNLYGEYKPHMTIAYMKPGTGKNYIQKLCWAKFLMTPNKIVYSKPDGTKIEKII